MTAIQSYNPDSFADRCALASALLSKLQAAGFSEAPRAHQDQELVFTRPVKDIPRFQIRVYTSLTAPHGSTPMARPSGADAIRTCLVYVKEDGTTRGIGSETRVNRTGDIDGICKRTILRLRAVRDMAPSVERCRCGAPLFLSKNKNLVCADLCWKK